MKLQRNWIAWAALVMAGFALVLALGGRMADRRAQMMGAMAQPAAQAQAWQEERGEPPTAVRERFEGGFPPGRAEGLRRDGPPAFAQGGAMSPMAMAAHHGPRHGFFPLMMLFGLINALAKLVAMVMLAWLLWRLFQQNRANTVPTTPAGHDPRVE
ncbi:MAG: hypothetical protein EI684_01270 [Candidatus Viridilinea halotolerans]|uniref:Uncharacterized protein n=1 Tax=Candidatus Viridilinea halotolerans TaxID=2491704 RepID=A0A426UAX2_9CHLR|nr:MAG: hypothetical protein EI684_01270 [Candidatus Viridilinea halotolerans]